jgi:hypothetical protein
MKVTVINPGNAVAFALGDAVSAVFKSEGGGLKHFDGKVSSIEQQGNMVTITAEDQMRKFRYRPIHQIYAPNYRRTNQVAISKDSGGSAKDKYYSDFRVGTDAIGYPSLDVLYIGPQTDDVTITNTTNLISDSASPDAHIAQAFRAQGHFLEGTIEYGISRGSADTAVDVVLRVVTNRRTGTGPAETDPRPSWASSSFRHAKMTNGNDAVTTATAAGTNASKKTSFSFAAPIKTIPGELYWLVAERDSAASTVLISAWGKSTARVLPYRMYASASAGQDHDPSAWVAASADNIYFAGMKYRLMVSKTEWEDFEVDETNHRIYWGGTSGFVPDKDAAGDATGKCLVRYSYGTENLDTIIKHIIQRCGISTYNIDAGVNATYGNSTATITSPIQIINEEGFAAMDAVVAKRYTNTGLTTRGRYFASSSTGTDTLYVKQENLTSASAWKTVKDGRDTGAGDQVLLGSSLRKMVQRVPTRVIVIGRDITRRPMVGMAENISLIGSVGTTVKVITDSNVRSIQEAKDAAKAIIDTEYSESYQGSITISGLWPEASGYFSVSGNSFSDIIAVSDTDLGIVASKFRAEEVTVKYKDFATTIAVTQRPRFHGLTEILQDVANRTARREGIDIQSEVILHFKDTTGSPAGTWAQFEVSGTAVPSWDGQVHRVPVTSTGDSEYVAVWEEEYLDLGGGSEQTNTRDITDMKFYTAYDSGTVQHTHTFTSDDKPRFLASQRVHFLANES